MIQALIVVYLTGLFVGHPLTALYPDDTSERMAVMWGAFEAEAAHREEYSVEYDFFFGRYIAELQEQGVSSQDAKARAKAYASLAWDYRSDMQRVVMREMDKK